MVASCSPVAQTVVPYLGIATVLMSIYTKRVDNFLYGVA